jgi:hypothetical protein
MRKLVVLLAAIAIAACSSSTAPNKAGDPSLLFTNNLDTPVYLTWQDGTAIVGVDTIPAHAVNHCSRFTAQPDSAYFQIVATEIDRGTPATTTVTAPWFNPATRPAWTVVVSFNAQGSPIVLTALVDTPC